MSRYSGYPRGLLLAKAVILTIALPVIGYLQLCNCLALHYREELYRYDDASQEISSWWPELHNFDGYHICLAERYLAAGGEAANYHPFDAWWMIRNWNTDFLAQQPPCSGQK